MESPRHHPEQNKDRALRTVNNYMKFATFINFTEKPFTGYWNGKPYTFQPGQKKEHLNSMIAAHFAKHLANQVLTESGKEQYCSPKKPNEVPQFMQVFNKAYFLEGNGQEVDRETGLPADGTVTGVQATATPDEPSMNIKTVPRAIIQNDPYDAHAAPQFGPGGKPQVIGEDDAFEGKEADDGLGN